MARFFHPLILMLASPGKSELARQVQYLKAENGVLRAELPKRVTVMGGAPEFLSSRTAFVIAAWEG